MLNVAQPLFGAVEGFVSTIFNGPSLVRLNRQPQNLQNSSIKNLDRLNSKLAFSLSSLVVNEFSKTNFNVIPSSSESASNELLQRKANLTFDVAFCTNSRNVQTIRIGNLTFLRSKNGGISVQQRGFRTKSYEKRLHESSSTGSSGFLSDFFKSLKEKEPDSLFKKLLKDNSDMKNLIGSQTKAETDKIKLAFAEGYLAKDKKPTPARGGLGRLLGGPFLFLIVFSVIFYYLITAIGGGMVRFGGTAGNEVTPEEVHVTFEDVRGIEEAKEQVKEIVAYLKDPEKFTRLGAHLPKGVLLVGQPGCGKTLLAKAIAGEAEVPFFRTSGSEFEEMLVGLGAKRVRDLFTVARSRAPCVIFIDEIDSIGSKRSYNAMHPYANQTINQLLNEMDGFLTTSGVIVLAATNRRQDLDPALLRPGRFDVEIVVPWPDLKGRIEIFNLYLSKVKIDKDVNVEILAKSTIGFTGADIENMVNQAALKAATDNRDSVNMHYFEMAHDLIKMGPSKARIPDEMVNKITAYHEAGHTLVAYFTKDSVPLHRVTIIPRGMSLGHTALRMEKEPYNQTKAEYLATMDMVMGGRAAEELQFGLDKVTSGASDDFAKATSIAEAMVKKLGMSEKVGFRSFDEDNQRSFVVVDEYGQSTKELLDSEIKRLLQESYERAKTLLKTHAAAHVRLAEALLKYETLDAEEVKQIIEGKTFEKKLF